MDLKRDLFLPVARRLRDRADSLVEIRRFPQSGIEGWLKVEMVAALGNRVQAIQNKGPDLVLLGGLQIELKAATDLNPQYLRDGASKYNTPCLFLGDGHDVGRIAQIAGNGIELIAYEVFSDGAHEWCVGLPAQPNLLCFDALQAHPADRFLATGYVAASPPNKALQRTEQTVTPFAAQSARQFPLSLVVMRYRGSVASLQPS